MSQVFAPRASRRRFRNRLRLGILQLTDTVYENLLPYPEPGSGPMQLALELVGGDPITLTGALHSIRAVDDACYVEALHDDMAAAG